MNTRKPLKYYLEDITRIDELSLKEWQSWSDEYPYVQNLKVILAKKHERLGLTDQLAPFHLAATYSIDRTRLYEVLHDTQTRFVDTEEDELEEALKEGAAINQSIENQDTNETTDQLNLSSDQDIIEGEEHPSSKTNLGPNTHQEIDDKVVIESSAELEETDEINIEEGVEVDIEVDSPAHIHDNIIEMPTENNPVTEVTSTVDEPLQEESEDKELDSLFALIDDTNANTEPLNIKQGDGEIAIHKDIFKENKKKNKLLKKNNSSKKKSKKEEKSLSLAKTLTLDHKEETTAQSPSKAKPKSKSSDTKKASNKKNTPKSTTTQNKTNNKKVDTKKSNNKVVTNILEDNSAYTQWLLSLRMAQSADIPYVDLSEEQGIKPKKPTSKKKNKKTSKTEKIKKLAQKSIQEKDEVISEVLADLLLAQGHKDKAKKMYNQLSLIFPEKSTYFAAKFDQFKKNK